MSLQINKRTLLFFYHRQRYEFIEKSLRMYKDVPLHCIRWSGIIWSTVVFCLVKKPYFSKTFLMRFFIAIKTTSENITTTAEENELVVHILIDPRENQHVYKGSFHDFEINVVTRYFILVVLLFIIKSRKSLCAFFSFQSYSITQCFVMISKSFQISFQQ